MRFDTNLIKNRAIIGVCDESFGITFTHWTRKRRSWSLRWQDVVAIDVMMVEVPDFELGFSFQLADGRAGFLSDNMENWSALEGIVRKRFPDFNWNMVETAKRFENRNKRFTCWKRKSAPQGK
jgi:hypothetical protein